MEDTSMDAQTMLIVVVIFIISAIILYFMSVYGFREKTYDEVIMEQKRMMAEEDSSKKDPKGKKPKKAKKIVKKITTTNIVQEDPEKKNDEETVKMVQLEIDAEIIGTQSTTPEKDTKKSHGRSENVPKKNREKEKDKAKSILTNKEEKSLVKETTVIRETIHTGPVPKDEVELHHERHVPQPAPELAPAAPEVSNKKRRDKRGAKEETKKPEEELAEKVKETVLVQEKVVIQETLPVKSEPPKKVKKERTPPAAPAKAAGDAASINKEDSDDWIKKSKPGDPIALLKKQLEEKERALAEEQQACLGAKMKVKEIHQELTNERNRYMVLEAQSKQNLVKQGDEVKALHARMQQTHEQHHAEVNAMKYQLEQIGAQRGNEGAVHRIQRLEQENKQLQEAVGAAQAAARNSMESTGMQQQIKMLQDELQKNVGKLTMTENAREKLENRLKKSEAAHKETETVLKKRLTEMSEAVKHMENKSKSMSYELDAATGTLAKRDNELGALRNQMKDMDKAASSHNVIRNLENKLGETENQKAMMEDQLRKIQQRLNEVEGKSGHKDDELKMLKNENAALKEELKSSRQRTSGEGQEAAVVREEPYGQVQAQKMTFETNNIIKEKDAALSNLQMELKRVQIEKDGKDGMVNQMQVELRKLQSERDHLQSSSKTTENAVSSLKDQLNKMQSEKDMAVSQLQQVKQENNTLTVQLQAASKDQGSAVNKLQEEIRKLQAERSSVVSQLEANLQAVKKEKDELSSKLQATSKGQDSTVAQLQEDIKKLTADLEKQRQKNNEDNNELQEKEKQLKELHSQVSSRNDQLTTAQQQLQQLQASYDELQSKNVKQDGVDGGQPSDQRVLDLQAHIEALQKENAKVEAQVSSVNTAANDTIQDLTRQVEQLRKELGERNYAVDNLQQKYDKDIQAKSLEMEQQNVTLSSKLNEVQTDFAQMKQQLEAEVNRLKVEAAASESNPKSSPADLERIQNLERDITQRNSSVSELRSELDSVNSQLSELLKNQQRNEESQAIAAKSMQELAQIKNDFNARLAEFERTKQELELIRKENHDLRLGCEKATRALTKAEKSAEEIAQIQKELTSKVSEVHTLRASLEHKDKLIHALQAAKVAADDQEQMNGGGRVSETRDIKGVTVVTRVEEKSTFDVSRILADKDALHAELQILRSILTSKEKELEELKEKYGETETSESHTEVHKHTHVTTTHYLQGQTVSMRDLELLRKQLHARELHIKSLQEQITQMKDDKREFQEKIVQHQIELHSASADVQDSLLENLAFKTTEIDKLREIVKEYWIVNNELRDRLSVYEDSEADDGSVVSSLSSTTTRRSTRSRDSQIEMVGDLQKQLASKASQLSKLSEEVVSIKREAEDLREKNSKAIDTMQKPSRGQSSDAKSDASSDKQQRATRELLQRLFPHVSVKSSLGHNDWMSAFEREASKYLKSQPASNSSQFSDVDSQLDEYRQNQGKLQAQVQHYKNVLAETEGILNRLQNSVENEETKWQEKVKSAEDDASKAKEEIKRLKSELEQKGPAGKGMANGTGPVSEIKEAASAASTNGEGTSV